MGQSWVSLNDEMFVVRKNNTYKEVSLEIYGCRPDDNEDDTKCFIQAKEELSKLNGMSGVINLGQGEWIISDSNYNKSGICLPKGVGLIGSGSEKTTVRRKQYEADITKPNKGYWFCLEGDNQVQGIRFF